MHTINERDELLLLAESERESHTLIYIFIFNTKRERARACTLLRELNLELVCVYGKAAGE